MTTAIKEKIYNLVILLCAALCIWLIGQVAADELRRGAEPLPIHVPPQVTEQTALPPGETGETDLPEGIVQIDMDDLAREIGKYMEALPLRQVTAGLTADGVLTLSAAVDKTVLFDLFAGSGIEVPKGAAALAPEEIGLSLSAQCGREEESGLLTLTPTALTVNGSSVDVGLLPEALFGDLSRGLNRLLLHETGAWAAVGFERDAFRLHTDE